MYVDVFIEKEIQFSHIEIIKYFCVSDYLKKPRLLGIGAGKVLKAEAQ